MRGSVRFAAAIAAMGASVALAGAEARPVPRERPAAPVPLARPEPPAAQGQAQTLVPLPKPPTMRAGTATGSLRSEGPAARHEREARCLAEAIYFEARSEPIEGQFAVARVILNRAADRRFPDTICAVVYQGATRKHRCHFSFACDGLPDEPEDETAWALARGMAEAMLRSEEPRLPSRVMRATHYHADYVAPWWAPKLRPAGQVGRHVFYVRPGQRQAKHASAEEAASH